MKKFLKKHFKANPISYIGWLGVFGIIGTIFFVPVFIPFLLCFTFFSYTKMQADELFWENVRKASSRGFWTVFLLDIGVFVWMFIRGMMMTGKIPKVDNPFSANLVTLPSFAVEQYIIAFFTLCVNLVVMILVFTISMMKFRRQEKKMIEEE